MVEQTVRHLGRQTAGWLSRCSIDVLRISVGLVFLSFGIPRFFPHMSPAQALVERTVNALSLGIVSGHPALMITATTECFIGITMITGKLLKAGLAVLAGSLVGIMSPLLLFSTDMFPSHHPTLEAQYIMKDIVLIAAGLVIAARALGENRHLD